MFASIPASSNARVVVASPPRAASAVFLGRVHVRTERNEILDGRTVAEQHGLEQGSRLVIGGGGRRGLFAATSREAEPHQRDDAKMPTNLLALHFSPQ